jgi:hypothetical protein
VAVKARQLDRSLIGFATGIAEEYLLHPESAASLSESAPAREWVEVGGMQQAPGLGRNRRNQFWMGMTERRDGDPGQGIQIFLTLGIGNPASLTVTERPPATGHRYS